MSLLLLATLIAGPLHSWGDLFFSGGWHATVDSGDLAGWAGSDLKPTLVSEEDTAIVELYANRSWRLDVERQGVYWPATVPLSVRLSGTSVSGGEISAVGGYVTVDEFPVTIATGTKAPRSRETYARLGLQYRVQNLSVAVGAGSFTTTVIYTITNR